MMSPTTIHPLKILAAVGAAFLVWGLVLAYASSPAQAATITVNSTDDVAANDGKCTLREAITSANTNTASGGCVTGSGDDTIIFALPPEDSPWTVNLTGLLPVLSSNIAIEGPGKDKLTVR